MEGKSFSAFLADAGRKALELHQKGSEEPFHLITFRGDAPVEEFNLDRTSELLASEDLATYSERTQ